MWVRGSTACKPCARSTLNQNSASSAISHPSDFNGVTGIGVTGFGTRYEVRTTLKLRCSRAAARRCVLLVPCCLRAVPQSIYQTNMTRPITQAYRIRRNSRDEKTLRQGQRVKSRRRRAAWPCGCGGPCQVLELVRREVQQVEDADLSDRDRILPGGIYSYLHGRAQRRDCLRARRPYLRLGDVEVAQRAQ